MRREFQNPMFQHAWLVTAQMPRVEGKFLV
jgi:hypothetical protein